MRVTMYVLKWNKSNFFTGHFSQNMLSGEPQDPCNEKKSEIL